MENYEKVGTSASDLRKVPNQREIEGIRSKQLFQFFNAWKLNHPEKRIYNDSLRDYIYVNHSSLVETIRYAKMSCSSTSAVLYLDELLKEAVLVKEVNSDPNTKSQRPYQKMLIMKHYLNDIGNIRLIVGVKRSDRTTKVQYSITVIDTKLGNGFAENKRHKKTNRRKPIR